MSMNLGGDQKVQVLLAELSERYNASHLIRERSTQFNLWIIGLALGLAWLLISHGGLSFTQKASLTALTASLLGASLVFLSGLAQGAINNRKALIRVEEALGMYLEGVYIEKDTLLPPQYKVIKKSRDNLSFANLVLLLVTAASLMALIWISPDSAKTSLNHQPTELIEEN